MLFPPTINKMDVLYSILLLYSNDINIVWVDTTRDRGTGWEVLGHGLEVIVTQNGLAKGWDTSWNLGRSIPANYYCGTIGRSG